LTDLSTSVKVGSYYEAGHAQVLDRTRTYFGRRIHTVWSGLGQEHNVSCTRMSDSSDVEVFRLATAFEETENKI
jgi:hypothetical protein